MTSSFNPIPQFSYADEFERTRKRQERNDLPRRRIEQLSDQMALNNANKAGDGVLKLAQFSSTLLNKVVENKKVKNENDRLEYLNKGFEQGWNQNLIDEFNDDITKLEEDREYFSGLTSELRKQGADFEAIDEVNNMNPWQTYGYAQGLAKAAGDRYSSWLENQMMDNDSLKIDIGGVSFTPKTAKGLGQKRAAMSALRTQYLETSGIAGLNPMLLEEQAFKTMRKSEAEMLGKFKKIFRKERSFELKQGYFTSFESDKNLNNLLEDLSHTYDDKGENLLGFSGAWKEVEAYMDRRFDAGMSEEELDEILDQKPTHGGGKTYRELYETRAKLWEEKRANQERKNLDDDLANQESEGKRIEFEWNNFVQKQIQQNQPVTETHLAETAAIYKSVTGKEAEFLKNFRTKQDMDNIQARKELKQLRKDRGYLVATDLTPYSSDIFAEFSGIVQKDAPLAEKADKYLTDAQDTIKGLTNDVTQLKAVDRNGLEYYRFYQNALADYIKIRDDNIKDGLTPDQAHKDAIARVEEKGELDSPNESVYFKRNDVVDRSETWKDREALANTMIKLSENPDLYKSVALPNIEPYIAQAEKYRDLGGEIPIWWKQLADKFDQYQPFDLMNYQLRVRGRKELVKPKVETAVDLTDADFQRLLRFRPTPISITQATIHAEEQTGINSQGYDSGVYLIPGLLPPE